MLDDDSTWDGLSGLGTLGGIAAFGATAVLVFAIGNQQGLGAAAKCAKEPACAIVTQKGWFGVEYQSVSHGASIKDGAPLIVGQAATTVPLQGGMLVVQGEDGWYYVAEVTRAEGGGTGDPWTVTFTSRAHLAGDSQVLRASYQLAAAQFPIRSGEKLRFAAGKAVITSGAKS